MRYMHWGPADLGYRAATQDHIDAILELMSEGIPPADEGFGF